MMDIKAIIDYLKHYEEEITLMEICGTHTAAIAENAIPSLISDKIHLVSGPGCPVCVTVSSYADRLCELALDGSVIVTFGDMIRVPGSKCSLKDARAQGADIRMIYSPLEILNLAKAEPCKNFVFAAVGFETTTPSYALLLDEIIKNDIKNIRLLTALKTMPAVISSLCEGESRIDGFIAPGHVAVITGSDIFATLAEKYHLPFVISGFKAEEILSSIYALTKLRGQGVELNLYKSVVNSNKNEMAAAIVNKYFEPFDASWRGLGIITGSGLVLKDEYAAYDAGSKDLQDDYGFQSGCCCGEIIAGVKKPCDCPLYKTVCTPENPKGACMVSSEGSCFNYLINDRTR